MSNAVSKLHNDLTKMRKAESALKKDQAAEKKANSAAKSDAAKEKAAVQGVKSQETALINQMVDSFSSATPPDAATTQKLLGQLMDLGGKEVTTADSFKAKIAQDKAAAAKAHKAEGKDKKSIKSDRKRALGDLKPAEYKMNLKDTNRVRKELGLKTVSKPIRPATPSVGTVTPTMRKLATDARSVAMSMGGYNSEGLCATGVCRAVQDAMGFYPGGNGNTIGNGLLASGKFKEIHIPLAQALKIPGLILSWQHTSTPEGRIYGHTAVTLGDGKESASDFVEYDTLSAAQSRSGLKIFMPIK